MSSNNKVKVLMVPMMLLALTLIVPLLPTKAYGAPPDVMSLDEAKSYLTSYRATELNDFGEPFTVSYRFKNEEQLDEAARYLSQYGVDAFNKLIDEKVAQKTEHDTRAITPYSVKPFTVYRTVSSNGTHRLSGTGDGTSNFGKYGSITFTANIGFSVVVSGGKISSCHSPWFKLSYLSSGAQMVPEVALPTSCNPGSGASVTANFKIERVVGVDVLEVVVGTSYEVFCLIAQQG